MAKSKALKRESNDLLRDAVRAVIREDFDSASEAAVAFGVSGAYLSDFLAGNRGAGSALLFGVAKRDPIAFLRAIGVDPATVVVLWRETNKEGELPDLPEPLRRAARAAIELLHCHSDEAGKAAVNALEELGEGGEDRDPVWWLERLKERITRRTGSGVRKKRRNTGS